VNVTTQPGSEASVGFDHTTIAPAETWGVNEQRQTAGFEVMEVRVLPEGATGHAVFWARHRRPDTSR
jgi:hypothetical protein